ncbi:MAG: T9SS type A sorting domain-containing protein [Bacteroidota bacterium]
MKNLFTIYLLLFCMHASLYAQVNLVRNPSLEQYSYCPNDWNQIKAADYWSPIDTLSNPPICAPEYCNVCAGNNPFCGVPNNGDFYQYPRSGRGMAQLIMYYDESIPGGNYYRDYLQGRLLQSLIAGKQYCVTFYTVLEEASDYAIANIGAYLDNGSIDNTDSVGCAAPKTTYIPQVENTTIIYDTMHWVKIQGTFTATGNEKFITIGNFRDKAHTSHSIALNGNSYTWYLIDDVSVIASDAIAYAGHDTIIGLGDSAYIGLHDEAMPYTWYVLGNSTPIDSGGGLWVKPTTTTSYVVKQTLCGVSTYDTVKVIVWPQGVATLNKLAKNVYPNPANDILYIDGVMAATTYTIQNLLGQRVQQGTLQLGNNAIGLYDIPRGMYLLELTDAAGARAVTRLVKE